MTQPNYALRLQASLKAEAERLAKADGTTLNQFINVAVAEKIAALRTADFFRERARQADLPAALALSTASARTKHRAPAMSWTNETQSLQHRARRG